MIPPSDIEDQGPTLRDFLNAGPFPIGLALEIAIQVLRAPDDLQALSPDNLRLVRGFDGSPRVERIDLGTAAGAEDSLEAPSGIHAFGVLLYELLTAAHPFQGQASSAPLSFQVSDRQRRLPPELRALVLATIAEDPEGRFESAEALAAELSRIQTRFPFGEPFYTVPSAARPVRGRRLPSHVSATSSGGILARLLALCAVLALLLVLWALVPEKAEAPAVPAETPKAVQDGERRSAPGPP